MREQSLAGDVADLTALLTRLTAPTQITPTPTGLDAALHARSAVLALARHVLTDLRLPTLTHTPGFADLHRHPGAVMAWALERHPTVPALTSPIDVARTATPGSTTALWEHAATLATRTHLRFDQLHLGEQPAAAVRAHPARGALIADLALTVSVLTRSETAMATTATALGDHPRAHALDAGQAGPLRLAADATWRTTPQNAPGWDTTVPPDARRLAVLPVRDPAALPAGLNRLSALLTAGLDLSPQHTASLITAQTRIALALAGHAPTHRPPQAAALTQIDTAAVAAATRTGRTDPRGAIHEGPLPLQASAVLTRPGLLSYARALAGAWNPHDDALSTVTASDPRPLQQAGECLRALQRASTPTTAATPLAGPLPRSGRRRPGPGPGRDLRCRRRPAPAPHLDHQPPRTDCPDRAKRGRRERGAALETPGPQRTSPRRRRPARRPRLPGPARPHPPGRAPGHPGHHPRTSANCRSRPHPPDRCARPLTPASPTRSRPDRQQPLSGSTP